MTLSFLLIFPNAMQNLLVLPLWPWPLFWSPNPTVLCFVPPLRYLIETSNCSGQIPSWVTFSFFLYHCVALTPNSSLLNLINTIQNISNLSISCHFLSYYPPGSIHFHSCSKPQTHTLCLKICVAPVALSADAMPPWLSKCVPHTATTLAPLLQTHGASACCFFLLFTCAFFFFLSWFLRFQLMCLSQRVLPWAVVTTHTYMVMLSCFHCLKLSCLHICSLIECLSPDPSLHVPLGQAPSLHEISVPRSLDQFWVQCVKSVKICTEWKKEGVNDHTWTLCWAPIKVCVDCVLL